MTDVFYTVIVYDLVRDRVDYEFRRLYDRLEDARAFADLLGPDDEFVSLVARHDITDLSIRYV